MLSAILDTISSKRFKKLTLVPITSENLKFWGEYDQALCSLAERLYKLGAVRPLTIEVDFLPAEPHIKRIWPRFCEAGAIVLGEDDWAFTGWWELEMRNSYKRGSLAISIRNTSLTTD